jgi:hypothetical protein
MKALLLALAATTHAAAYTEADLLDAIKVAEGQNPRWWYGIHHPDTPRPLCEPEARHRCLNTIRHAERDWNHTGDFVDFLSLRYCPVNHKQWSVNVHKLLKNK